MAAKYRFGPVWIVRGILLPLALAGGAAGLAAPAAASGGPSVTSGTLANVLSVTSDSNSGSACALLSTGGVDCWGNNGDGELGNGSTSSSDVPVKVVGLTGAKAVAEDNNGGGGGGSFCALLSAGTIKCWGYNNDGELGNGTTTNFTLPVTVKKITNAIAVIGGDFSFCAVLATKHVDCWGYNGDGELGNGTFNSSDVPVAVTGLGTVSAVIGGHFGFCALLPTAHVDCWGYNGDGELGNGTFNSSDVPVAARRITSAVQVATAGSAAGSVCALLSTGHVNCWGYNADGQLGNGTTSDSDVPVAVVNLTSVKAVTEDNDGGGSFCALLSAGTIKCWGYNADGELGNGTTTNFTLPVAVKKITNATAVIGGDFSFCALLSTSQLNCWGYNGDGELGNGTFNSSDVPVAVRGIANAAKVTGGTSDFCTVLATSHVDCWGYNGDGELGNGTFNSSDVPVAVRAAQ